MKQLHAVFILMAALMLGACGAEEVKLPPADPLSLSQAEVDQLYGAIPGPFTVTTSRDLVLPGREGERELTLNLYYPAEGENFPLLLFSHGNWSNKDSYDRVIEHWVSHGYAVVAPNHLDCCSMAQGIFNSLRYGQLGLIDGRLQDLSSLLRHLGLLAVLDPGFVDKADISRLALTGHSFGAFSAQQFGGAQAFDPDQESFVSNSLPTVNAVVAISPPGPMFDTITESSWKQLATPTLVTTGTWDSNASFWPDWQAHLLSYESALPGDKYALVIQGADHYLGNLICRLDREHPPQTDALRMLQITSTAFLDRYLKHSAEAGIFLLSDTLEQQSNGFSSISAR